MYLVGVWLFRIFIFIIIISLIIGNFNVQDDVAELEESLKIVRELRKTDKAVNDCMKSTDQWRVNNPHHTIKEWNNKVRNCIYISR